MAKCEKREIKPEPPPVEYVLTLSAHEAEVLLFALENGAQFPRGSQTFIGSVLIAAGVRRV